MKTSLACGALLFVGLVGLLPSCGSDSNGTADGSAGDDGNPSAGKASGGSSKGGSSSGGTGSDVGGADSNTGGADSNTGGADSNTGGADSNTGGADSNTGGTGSNTGGEGNGSTGEVSADWFCTQVGEACSCIPRPENVPATNACTLPLAPCCFTFVSQNATNCQCQPTTAITCPQWLDAIKGTAVNACPPPS